MNLYIDNKNYHLNVTPYQMIICMKFNNVDSVLKQELYEYSGMEKTDFNNHLNSLIQSNILNEINDNVCFNKNYNNV